ncbi:MAG: hypothetical protein JWN95_1149 [Frankiales bacterium]|nr:hypothetical protein [Frankiales bacterium]
MRNLFEEAQLSSGAVYRYFASKDDVIVAIAEENMREVVALIHDAATERHDRSAGVAMAAALEIVQAKHATHGLGGLAVLAWAEALRNPNVADQFTRLLSQMREDLAAVVRQQNSGKRLDAVPPDALAALLISIVPGYILQLALLGPVAVQGVPDALRALWPPAPAPTK